MNARARSASTAPVPSGIVLPDRLRPLIVELQPFVERFVAAGRRIYLVGGSVRDALVADRPTLIEIRQDSPWLLA